MMPLHLLLDNNLLKECLKLMSCVVIYVISFVNSCKINHQYKCYRKKCNTDKPIEKAEFLGTVESKVTTIAKQMNLTPKLLQFN